MVVMLVVALEGYSGVVVLVLDTVFGMVSFVIVGYKAIVKCMLCGSGIGICEVLVVVVMVG